jgi:hypothetical protein
MSRKGQVVGNEPHGLKLGSDPKHLIPSLVWDPKLRLLLHGNLSTFHHLTRSQPCTQGRGDASCLFCLLGAA